ncbi:MAG: hypothetical protein ACI8R4_003728, partial [Paracoccaceae bacterium]
MNGIPGRASFRQVTQNLKRPVRGRALSGLDKKHTTNDSIAAVVSMGRRNTLIFRERWSVLNEVSHTDILYGQTEVRDVGSVA